MAIFNDLRPSPVGGCLVLSQVSHRGKTQSQWGRGGGRMLQFYPGSRLKNYLNSVGKPAI